MFKKVIFATSATPGCDGAARVAFDLAEKYGAEIVLFHVLGIPGKGDSTQVLDVRTGESVDADEEYLEGVTEELKTTYAKQLAKGPRCRIEIAVGAPAREILRLARSEDPDLIVMGGATRAEGGLFKRGVTGGSLRKVAKNARCPVLVVSRPAASFWGGFSSVLFATDFSRAADSAFQFALATARELDAELHLFHCFDLSHLQSAMAVSQEGIEDKLAEARRRLHANYAAPATAAGLKPTVEVWEGVPYVEIVKYARERQADLIVMAHPVREIDPEVSPFGSTFEQVIVRATCPVASVNRPDKLPAA
jgi:nucleotide-binding universal stress UspA family protein